MPDINDLISLVRDPYPRPALPTIWDYAPCHASLVGSIPDLRRYYLDVELKLAYQLRLRSEFPTALILPGIWPDLGVVVEASAFGGRITWFENGAPFIAPCIADLKAVDRLNLPDPWNAGLMPLYVVQLRRMQELLVKKNMSLERISLSMGPAEIAGLILGHQSYYLGYYMDPKRVLNLMKMITEFIVQWLGVQESVNGKAELIVIGDHVPHQVRPAHLEEFILPFLKIIFQEFPHAVRLYHNEGFHTDRHIALMQQTGFDIWHFGSDNHNLDRLYPLLEDRICLFGGLDPHGVLRTGTPDEVRAETRACIKIARGKRLLLSSGTGTTPDVPPENVRAMIDTASESASAEFSA